METPLYKKLESALFAVSEPVSIKKLCEILDCTEGNLNDAKKELIERQRNANSGIILIEIDNMLSLSTAGDTQATIEKIQKQSTEKEIGQAGLEVLSILLYIGPSTKSKIDYIRGVNSSSSIRNLVIRGLVKRTKNPNDARENLYKPTMELMSYMGVAQLSELPEYETISNSLNGFGNKQED